MKYWEIIAVNLSKAAWSWDSVSAIRAVPPYALFMVDFLWFPP